MPRNGTGSQEGSPAPPITVAGEGEWTSVRVPPNSAETITVHGSVVDGAFVWQYATTESLFDSGSLVSQEVGEAPVGNIEQILTQVDPLTDTTLLQARVGPPGADSTALQDEVARQAREAIESERARLAETERLKANQLPIPDPSQVYFLPTWRNDFRIEFLAYTWAGDRWVQVVLPEETPYREARQREDAVEAWFQQNLIYDSEGRARSEPMQRPPRQWEYGRQGVQERATAGGGWDDSTVRGTPSRPWRMAELDAQRLLGNVATFLKMSLPESVEGPASRVGMATLLNAMEALLKGGAKGNPQDLVDGVQAIASLTRESLYRRQIVAALAAVLGSVVIGDALTQRPAGRPGWVVSTGGIPGRSVGPAWVSDGRVTGYPQAHGGWDFHIVTSEVAGSLEELEHEQTNPGVVAGGLVSGVVEDLLADAADEVLQGITESIYEAPAVEVVVDLPVTEEAAVDRAASRPSEGVGAVSQGAGLRSETEDVGEFGYVGETIVAGVDAVVRPIDDVIADERTLRMDTKTRGSRNYLALLTVANRTWGTISEVGDFGRALLASLRDSRTGKPVRSWAAALDLRKRGRLEFDQDAFALNVLHETLADWSVASLSNAERHAIIGAFGPGSLLANMYGLPSTWASRLTTWRGGE